MKKLLVLIIAVCTVSIVTAQVNQNALGIRFGYGGGVSYQHGLNKTNRLELNVAGDISSYYTNLRASGAYQWVKEVSVGLNIYAGPSLSVGILIIDENKYSGHGNDGLSVSAGGQLGIDYNFQSIPIQISVDAMPQFAVLNALDNDFTFDPALGIRWVF